MKTLIFLLFDLVTTLAKLLRPGGSRAVIAENLLLEQQLIIHSRSGQRAPNLSARDRALDLDKDTVQRVLATHYRTVPSNRGPSWLTTIGHAKDSLWSIDLFRCESILLTSHWIMVVMDQYTRRIIGLAVHSGNVDGPALCRMFNEATSGHGWPSYLSSDNDLLFQYHRWKANLRVLEIEEIRSLPHAPMSHPFIERLIGSIRRELLDQTLYWTATDLENKLREYQCYYNEHRCHSSRDGNTPMQSGGNKVVDISSYRWEKHCRGLFQLPVAD